MTGLRWGLQVSRGYGRMSTTRSGVRLRTDGADITDQNMTIRGAARPRLCASCRQHWWDGYSLATPPGIINVMLVLPDRVYLCPPCIDSSRGGVVMTTGRWTL